MRRFDTPSTLEKLTIEITTDCNLKCAGCPRTVAIKKGNWFNRSISKEAFSRILQNIPYARMATLHGIGEPMLHADFIDLVKMARQSGKFGLLKVTTNGVTRSTDYYKKAVENGLDQVWISVDSFDPIVALQMRRGSNLKKLEDNIRECIQKNLPIRISTVISRTNLLDLERLFIKLYELGNPIVHTQEFQDFGDAYGMLTTQDRLTVKKIFEQLKNRYADIRVIPPQFVKSKSELCMAPWLRPAISVDGYLTPCCTTFDPTHFGFANISQYSFSQLWCQEQIQTWLNRMYNNEIEMCNGCGLNPRLNRSDISLSRSGKSGLELHVVNAN